MSARLLPLLPLLALAAGCTAALPRPTAAHAALLQPRYPGVTEATLTEGRRLYQARCSGCHLLRAPEGETEAEWKESLQDMQARSRLSDPEREAVLQYLAAFAKDAVPSTPAR